MDLSTLIAKAQDIFMPKKKTVSTSSVDVPIVPAPVVPTPAPVSPAVDTNPFEDPNHPTRWQHRRRMAYLSLGSMIIVMIGCLTPYIPVERVKAAENVIDWFYFAMASIVGAYMGLATWSAKTAGRSTPPSVG